MSEPKYIDRNINKYADIHISPCPNPNRMFPGYCNGPLVRDVFVMHCCTEGKGILTSDGIDFEIGPGMCFVEFPNTIICEKTDEYDPWAKLRVNMYGADIQKIIESLGFSSANPVFPHPFNDVIKTNMRELVDTATNQSPFIMLKQLSCISNVFSELANLLHYDIASRTKKKHSDYVQETMNYLNFNYDKKILISDIAARLGINRSHLYTLFKEETGASIKDYLIAQRIQKGCEFLLNTNASISQIAASVGYDALSFSKVFKRVMNISPKNYRKQFK
ncbi:MAG: AraC family transcriptional regulator [Clostridia bacterium]|nr:AraC family transcriptional regulator [Clostridia bacterium]